MARLTVRDLPDEVREALRVRAAHNGRSTEAEVRAILIETVSPGSDVRLGSLLADIGREIELTDEEAEALAARDRTPPTPLEFE
ncbi:Arc-like DNA binding domain-containing protein [Nocardia nova SH22a]|uniref:Arc-like DNA binding domain-containing protein n=1 Tax=Nocardia nova SH22a TaxID=1415166 RepID=W5TC52_9NOCA|nr:Arc family DNA-binding protein [Nocardia nova]AHH16764.1 Arc-like DNA binding domain-containing protein [Nocardia nova SH22a]